jgi:N-acetylglucosamine kinase-like BadF-type ATPase
MVSEEGPAWLLGIDGGGTKTQFLIADTAGKVAASFRGLGSYHIEIGVEGVAEVLAAGIRQVIEEAGIQTSDIAYAFFGLPAFGEDRAADERLAVIPSDILGHDRYTVENDMICAWAGSLGGEDGINVVAGTGSIAYGERGARRARCGGWGEAFGDEGSAYWVSARALNLFTRMSDGREAKGALYELFRERLKLRSDLEILERFLSDGNRAGIAALAAIVGEAVAAGDERCSEIFEAAATELAALAGALSHTLGYSESEAVPVSYSGGMFSQQLGFLPFFERAILRCSRGLRLQPPQLPPHCGAIVAASRHGMLRLPQSALEALASSGI